LEYAECALGPEEKSKGASFALAIMDDTGRLSQRITKCRAILPRKP
jgi:hypothetical protein